MPGETPNIPSRGPMPQESDGSNETPHIQLAMQYILEYAMSGSDRMQEILEVANTIIHAPGHEDEEPNLLAEFATTIVQTKVPSRFIPAVLTFDLPPDASGDLKQGVEMATRVAIQYMLQTLVPFAVVASGLNELARENVSVYTLLGMSRIDQTAQNKEAAVQRILGKLRSDFRIPLYSRSYSQDRIDARWVKRLPLGFDHMTLSQYERLVKEEAPAVLELGAQFMKHVIEQQQSGNVVAADEDTSSDSSALVAGLTPALILRHLDINAKKIAEGVNMVNTAVYLCIRDERRPDAPTDPQESPVPSGSPAGGGESGRVRR